MRTVNEIMTTLPLSCNKDEMIDIVADKMFARSANFLTVTNGDKKVVGTINYIDICMAPDKLLRPKEQIMVSEVMNPYTPTVNTFDDEASALKIMRMNKANALPVVDDDNTLKGTISFMSIARRIIGFKQTLKASF